MGIMLPIPVGEKVNGVHKRTELEAFETCCPDLVVHKKHGDDPEWSDWSLSHRGTGYVIIRTIPRADTARLLAGALSQIFNWADSRITMQLERYKALPPELKEWLNDWRRR